MHAFTPQDIDLVDIKITERTDEYARLSIRCKAPPSDDKIELIRKHIEAMASEESSILVSRLLNAGITMNFTVSLPIII